MTNEYARPRTAVSRFFSMLCVLSPIVAYVVSAAIEHHTGGSGDLRRAWAVGLVLASGALMTCVYARRQNARRGLSLLGLSLSLALMTWYLLLLSDRLVPPPVREGL